MRIGQRIYRYQMHRFVLPSRLLRLALPYLVLLLAATSYWQQDSSRSRVHLVLDRQRRFRCKPGTQTSFATYAY